MEAIIACIEPVIVPTAATKAHTEAVANHMHPFEPTATTNEKIAKPFLTMLAWTNLNRILPVALFFLQFVRIKNISLREKLKEWSMILQEHIRLLDDNFPTC